MSQFAIDFTWLDSDCGDPVSKGTFAEISILAGGQNATLAEDLLIKTVRPGIRVSAYSLALWLADNWWRLCWEPHRASLHWDMAHKIGAIGRGCAWPDLTFISDGATILVRSRAAFGESLQPLRYLNSFDAPIPRAAFEKGVEAFVEAVIGRLTGMNLPPVELQTIWKDVMEERGDPAGSQGRKLEALMGFDPDEAPEGLVEGLLDAAGQYGNGAVEEIAAESSANAMNDIHALWYEVRGASPMLQIPDFDALRGRLRDQIDPSMPPWQRGVAAALTAREAYGLPPGPVSDSLLANLLSMDEKNITAPAHAAGPMNAGFRNGLSQALHIHMKSPIPANRRFALMRLVGDHLTAPEGDRLLPAGTKATQRQKFQRAFAQEFLCPYSDLMRFFEGREVTDDLVEEAGLHFNASPLMVKTILVNRDAASHERFAGELRG